MLKTTKKLFILASLTLIISGCQSAYYGALEKVGIHKRDVMVDRVEKTRDSQEDAKQEFANALEQFKSVVKVDGGNLEKMYNKLNDEYESSKAAAEEVSDRIDSVKSVSEALFEEWNEEIKTFSNASMKSKSQQQLNNTKRQYQKLMRSMRTAEKSMKPVLAVFHDQVLFLKHNLNAQAISSIKTELTSIENNVSQLIKQMNTSIGEANEFIKNMN